MRDSCLKEALLYERLTDKKVRCNTCNRHCIISPNKLGFCKTRQNRNGKLYTLEYGLISSINVNPIEKKPLFHFWPGSSCLTLPLLSSSRTFLPTLLTSLMLSLLYKRSYPMKKLMPLP